VFPAEAGPHLPTSKGWKAELAYFTYAARRWWEGLMFHRCAILLTGPLISQIAVRRPVKSVS